MNEHLTENLLIIGAGQYGRVAEETAQATGRFDEIAFLDDLNEAAVGKIADCEKFVSRYPNAFAAIGNADLRSEIIGRLEKAGYNVVTLISPRAYVAPSATLGKGVIVEPMAVVNAHAVVGTGTLVCAGAIINHNAVVGDGCQIDCGGVVGAGAEVPVKTKIGCNEVFKTKF